MQRLLNRYTIIFLYFSIVTHFQSIKNKFPNAEQDDSIVTFKFLEPDGVLQLQLDEKTISHEHGWRVNPQQEPMKVFLQHVFSQFTLLQILQVALEKSPVCCSMSVYAIPGIAKEPLHCPIKLRGIIPEGTIYINRSPPPTEPQPPSVPTILPTPSTHAAPTATSPPSSPATSQ